MNGGKKARRKEKDSPKRQLFEKERTKRRNTDKFPLILMESRKQSKKKTPCKYYKTISVQLMKPF